MARYFIHKTKADKLEGIAEVFGGFEEVEVMVIKDKVELMVPRWDEEKEDWVEIKLHKGE